MPTAASRHPHDQVIRTVCGACPAGCGIAFYVKNGHVVDVLGDEAHPVNHGAQCARGTAAVQHFDHPARRRQPAMRQALDHELAPCSWDEALSAIAGRLKAVAAAHGPAAVGVVAADGPEVSDRIGAALFAAALGARLLPEARPAPDAAAAGVFGPETAPWLTVPAAEWPRQGCLLLLGGDPATDFPVAFRHVLDARARHVPLLAAAPRFTATLGKADFALTLNPGSEAVFLFALFKVVCESGALVAERAAGLAGLDAWRAAAADLEWPAIERLTGQPRAAVQRAGVMWARHQPGVIVGGGAVTPGAAGAAAGLLAVSRALENAARPAGWNWLAAPPWPFATGAAPAPQAAPRVLVGSGDFWPRLAPGEQAQAEFVVQFGAYPDETQEHSHVILPAASWAEVEDLHAGHDRRLQWQTPVLPPPGQARGALEFWAALAERLGLGEAFPWRTAGGRPDVRACAESLLAGAPALAGLDVESCRAVGGATWPGPARAAEHDAALGAPPGLAVPEPDRGHPLLLCRDVPAEGDAAWWPWLHAREAAVFDLNPAVAAALDIENGAPIWVDDGRRRLAGRARVTPAVPLRTIWSSAGSAEVSPVVVFRQRDHMLQSLTRLRGLFAQIERRA